MHVLSHPSYRLRWHKPAVSTMVGFIVISTAVALGPMPTSGDPTVMPAAAAAVAASLEPRQRPDAQQEAVSPAARSAILRLLILERAGPHPFGFFH